MKCKNCKNKYKSAIMDLDYISNDQTYKIINVPVLFCESCMEYKLTNTTEAFIDKFIKTLDKRKVYDFKKIKENDDASIAAANAIIIM